MSTEETDALTPQDANFDVDLEDMKRRYEEIEKESQKLKDLHEESQKIMEGVEEYGGEPSEIVDMRSIYVGNVDYSSTPEEIQEHFQACGTINRVTILCDKFTGHPKGFAYVEFAQPESVAHAVLLNESMFKGRQLKVNAKRTNVPAFMLRGRRPYRGGYRGRGTIPRGARGGRARGRATYYAPY
ncbi:cytoplasmic RNA-binding protein [Nowakowskiella sp. JEL0407]|nr:cytoplasmic RNA-binding protein [Nowakowskiella sp. JEL0407]